MGTEVRYSANPKQTAANADWLIGESIFMPNINGKALRSMKDPGSAYDDPNTLGKDPQPGTMAGYVNTDQDTGGVHINSGIPNHAFFLAATMLGVNSWDKAGLICMRRSATKRSNRELCRFRQRHDSEREPALQRQ